MIGSRVLVGHVHGDAGASLGKLFNAVLDAVLRKVAKVGAERVGLHRVDTHRKVGLVHLAHDVGSRDVEHLVAALVALEVVHRRVAVLQHRAHRAVGDDDAAGQRVAQGIDAVGVWGAGRGSHWRRFYGCKYAVG